VNTFSHLLALTTEYAKTANKRVTYEYILIRDLNDTVENAQELANNFKDIKHLTFINLIMYNPVSHASFVRSSNNSAYRFLDVLKNNGISAFIRFSEGQEIEGACGQLAGGIE
jgi:23S rRNA (adenine2503-C2)-methyltransferase